jgi:Rho GTPase-activating protein 1
MSSHVNSMRSALAAATKGRSSRARSNSLSTVPPTPSDDDYLPELAAIAASILYRSPHPSPEGRPLYILNAAAFPNAFEVDYDTLLSYVLARLPDEEELISGTEYEIVFFAGGQADNSTSEKKQGPPTGWHLQAYQVLSRATRKKLQRLYIVHPRTWVRVLIGIFGTIVSPKVRRKIVHASTLTSLAEHIPIERLLIPPSVYLHDRKLETEIHCSTTGRRAFGVRHPLPKNLDTGATRLPRILRETTSFLMLPANTKMEGLFRIPPHSVLSGVLKEAYDRGQHYIVWKEGGATLCQPGIDPGLVDEVRLEDAYGVHLAASLIKLWYRELREPIFAESSYALLREKFGDSTKDITPEDLVDLILPASQNSPLSLTSREILTRHLLPLLSVVASQSSSNKMTSDNLAILFSMCLVCGSNQLEDGRFSTVVKRILHSAIDMWPELRSGMGIDHTAFLKDILPPPDPRDYEDPLESPWTGQHSSTEKDLKGHRISMAESDSSSTSTSTEEKKPPALPPRRRSRASSLKAALTPHLPHSKQKPSPPRRKPAPQQHLQQTSPPYDSDIPADPPRYSTVFDAQGNSLRDEDFSTTLGPADGFHPSRTTSFEQQPIRRKNPPLPPQTAHHHLAGSVELELAKTNSIRRKPVSRQASGKEDEESNAHLNIGDQPHKSTSTSAAASEEQHFSETQAQLARLAVEASGVSQRRRSSVETAAAAGPGLDTSASPAVIDSAGISSSPVDVSAPFSPSLSRSGISAGVGSGAGGLSSSSGTEQREQQQRGQQKEKEEQEHVFLKPSLPASASRQQTPLSRQNSQSSLKNAKDSVQNYSLARPVLPAGQQQRSATVPGLSMPGSSNSSSSYGAGNYSISAGGEGNDSGVGRRLSALIPKVRAPSPGLLRRMASMESPLTPSLTPSLSPAGEGSYSNRNGNVDSNRGVGNAGVGRRLGVEVDVQGQGWRKSSVDDLKRLYEERAGTAQVLVGLAGKGK